MAKILDSHPCHQVAEKNRRLSRSRAAAGSGLTDTQRLNWLEMHKTVRVEWWEDAQFREYCMVLHFFEDGGMKEINDHFQHYDLRQALDYAIQQIPLQNNEIGKSDELK